MEFFRVKINIGVVKATHDRVLAKSIAIAYENESGEVTPIPASRVLFKRSTESGLCKLWMVNLLEESDDDANISHIDLQKNRHVYILAE